MRPHCCGSDPGVQTRLALLARSPTANAARTLAGASSYLIAAFVDASLTLQHMRSGRGNDYLSRLELGALVECHEAGHHLLVELIDIAEQEAMVERYGLRIPVLRRCDTGAELDWPFDAATLSAWMAGPR